MDKELNKQLALVRNKGALTNGMPTSETFNNTDDSLEQISDNIGQPQDRTNFQSLETMVGVPDAANSNLDDILRTGYDSSGQSANEDGSIIERLEQLQEAINVGTGSSVPANKSLYDLMGTGYTDSGAGEEDTQSIREHLIAFMGGGSGTPLPTNSSIIDALGTDGTTPIDTAGSLQGSIGVDDADNAFASTNVVANEDGSVLERLEQIQEAVNRGTGTSLGANQSIADALGTTGAAVNDSATSVLGAIGANNANNAFDSSSVVENRDGSVLERLEDIRDEVDNSPKVHEVVLYPTAIHSATTELSDDGTSPAYVSDTTQTTANAEGSPGVSWSENLQLEAEGTITVISIYAEIEWQTRFVDNAGAGNNTNSKFQISNDGGSTWVDLTDNYTHTGTSYATRIRAGTGRWITTVTAGTDQLGFRLVHWTDDGGSTDASDAQIRSNSYIRIAYVKS